MIIIDKYATPGSEAGYALKVMGGSQSGRISLQVSSGLNGGSKQYLYETTTSVNVGNWHHILVTGIRGVSTNFYIDGKIKTTTTAPNTTSFSNNDTFSIGRHVYVSYGTYFNGQIDDVRIYNYALTSEQVKNIYSGGSVNFR